MTDTRPTLLADIGGTRTRFALAWPEAANPLDTDSVQSTLVVQHASLADAAVGYLDTLPPEHRPHHAVFAIAGRTDGDSITMTNHRWTVSTPELQRVLGLRSLHAINDFAAIGLGLPLLGPRDSVPLGTHDTPAFDTARQRTFAVLGPGTGLGVGALLLREGRMFALQTEGGHVGVAPGNALEIEVLKVLQRRFGRVSAERLLCGQGLVNLEAALLEIEGRAAESGSPEAITAQAESSPRQRRTLAVFCDLLAATAGDFVLGYGAWQGAWLAGGLVPHLLPWLRRPEVRQRFEDKGRFADAMRDVPVRAIVHPHPGLLGAAAQAMLDAGRSPLPACADSVATREETPA